jgi:hypothetical protein
MGMGMDKGKGKEMNYARALLIKGDILIISYILTDLTGSVV